LLRGLLFFVAVNSAALECQELTVQTDSGNYVLSRVEIEALPAIKVTGSEHSHAVNLEGASLKSVWEKAGITFGVSMKGKTANKQFACGPADGYGVVIAFPKLAPV
jgi:hypothetical protein